MTARYWMPLHVEEYRAATSHFSLAEHGSYCLLMMHYWSNGGLPTDDARLARIARMTPEEWKTSGPVIKGLFGEDWRHGRLDAELAKMKETSEERRKAAQARWDEHANASANAMPLTLTPTLTPTPTPTPTPTKKESKSSESEDLGVLASKEGKREVSLPATPNPSILALREKYAAKRAREGWTA